MLDLFGNEVSAEEIAAMIGRTRERASERAYRILTQEYGFTEGKKCAHCKHLFWKRYSKKYPKCDLSGCSAGSSRGSDWNSRWAACGKFEPNDK